MVKMNKTITWQDILNTHSISTCIDLHARIQRVLHEGFNSATRTMALDNEGEREYQLPLKVSHHLSAIETPFIWRFAGVPMMAQHWVLALYLCAFFRRSGPVLRRNPIFLWPPPPSGSAHDLYPFAKTNTDRRSAHYANAAKKISREQRELI